MSSILADWRLIVGPALSSRCQPVMLEARGAVLHLQASGAAALEIQHAAPQLIERINTYFGFRAVRRLRLVQAPLSPAPCAPIAPPERQLDPAERQALADTVALVADEPLRAALLGLGRSLLAVRR